jgi:predicted neuraminidase|tara:strand:+ start:1012 stop:1992 length:981 start_codon:yes stop_codon:yes gene_type:complete
MTATPATPIQHIFADKRPFAQCHASTLVQFADHTFLAAWFGGSKESNADVGIWGADYQQGQWSTPRLLAKTRDDAHWNPVLHIDEDGRVYLFFKVGVTIPDWETWLVESDDGGQHWTEPRELVARDRGGRGPVKNKMIILGDGAWLAGASFEKDGWDVFVDRSEDRGQTWTASDLVDRDRAVFTGHGAIQPTLWESAPEQVHMLVRTTCGKIGRSDSSNGGRSWSPLYTTDLPNNNSGLDLARLNDGTLALVCNPIEKGRTPICILLSTDNGQTWPRRLDLEIDEGEYSYPAIIATETGMAITYTWKRERIAFWQGSIETEHKPIS